MVAALTVFVHTGARGAELVVSDLAIRPGFVSGVIVSGAIENEATFGVTVRLELVPRSGSVGTVVFSQVVPGGGFEPAGTFTESANHGPDRAGVIPSPSTEEDVESLGDPWPQNGTLTFFDTDKTGSATLNGVVTDNGTYVPSSIRFSGELAGFPVAASVGASGVWDVVLSTSVGESSWEGVATVLRAGTITVTLKACIFHAECEDGDPCTADSCSSGQCHRTLKAGDCAGTREDEGLRPGVSPRKLGEREKEDGRRP